MSLNIFSWLLVHSNSVNFFRSMVQRRSEKGASRNNELLKQRVIWFADVSKSEKGVSVGAWRRGSGQEIVCSLEPFITVFQAKGQSHHGVSGVSRRAFLIDDVRYHSIVICWDSRAALMALDSFLKIFKEVLKCRELLEGLAVNNSGFHLWVLNHSDILEKADSLANRGCQGVRATHCSVGMDRYYLELLRAWRKAEARKGGSWSDRNSLSSLQYGTQGLSGF